MLNIFLTIYAIFLAHYSVCAGMPENYHTTTLDQCQQMNKAIHAGNTTKVKKLLIDGYHPDRGVSFGNIPLIHAAVHNKNDIVNILISHGADLNRCNEFGITPFLAAIMFKNFESAQSLLQHGATPLLKERLVQTIKKIMSNYQYYQLDPTVPEFIHIHTSDQSLTHQNMNQYALTRTDLIFLEAGTMPHARTKNISSEKKRFQQYTKDTHMVLKTEYGRTRNLLIILSKELPMIADDLLYLIISFESACPLRQLINNID